MASGTKISYNKLAGGGIQKIVEKANGNVFRSTFYDGKCAGVVEKTAKGTIEHSFGAANYDKVIIANSNRGEHIVRLGHKNNPNRFSDTNHNANGKSVQGDFTQALKDAISYIRNGSSQPQSNNMDSFLKFCQSWVK